MTDMVVVSQVSNRYLCAELISDQYLKMLEEEERSIININLKKYPKQIQHHVADLKMELLVKIVNDCKP